MTGVTGVGHRATSSSTVNHLEPAPRELRQPSPLPAEACSVAGSTSVAADPGDTPRSDLRRTRCEARVPLASHACSSSAEDVVEASGTHTPN